MAARQIALALALAAAASAINLQIDRLGEAHKVAVDVPPDPTDPAVERYVTWHGEPRPGRTALHEGVAKDGFPPHPADPTVESSAALPGLPGPLGRAIQGSVASDDFLPDVADPMAWNSFPGSDGAAVASSPMTSPTSGPSIPGGAASDASLENRSAVTGEAADGDLPRSPADPEFESNPDWYRDWGPTGRMSEAVFSSRQDVTPPIQPNATDDFYYSNKYAFDKDNSLEKVSYTNPQVQPTREQVEAEDRREAEANGPLRYEAREEEVEADVYYGSNFVFDAANVLENFSYSSAYEAPAGNLPSGA